MESSISCTPQQIKIEPEDDEEVATAEVKSDEIEDILFVSVNDLLPSNSESDVEIVTRGKEKPVKRIRTKRERTDEIRKKERLRVEKRKQANPESFRELKRANYRRYSVNNREKQRLNSKRARQKLKERIGEEEFKRRNNENNKASYQRRLANQENGVATNGSVIGRKS